MAELFTAVIEGFVGLIVAFIEALPAIVEFLISLLVASVTIIAYVLSPKFRERKRMEWRCKPGRKYLELGFSTVCLAAILGLATWGAVTISKPTEPSSTFTAEGTKTGEDMRLVVDSRSNEGASNKFMVSVKEGGISNLFKTKTLGELKRTVHENVTVTDLEINQTNTVQSTEPPKQTISLQLNLNN